MLRTLIKRFGVIQSTLMLTTTAVLASALITLGIDVAFLGGVEWADLIISTVVPALVAPPFT